MPIITLENDASTLIVFPRGDVSPLDWARHLTVRNGRYHLLSREGSNTQTVAARIDHGRWMAECPFCACAMMVSKSAPWMWCPECGCARTGGKGLRVVFPAEIRTIETILLMRPKRENRNWRPGESVAQLARENIDHGCTVILEK